jgi:MscS family membrane protein
MVNRFLIVVFLALGISSFSCMAGDRENILSALNKLEQFNKELQVLEDETAISALIEQKAELLESLLVVLRGANVQRLPYAVTDKKLDFLASRMAVNIERGNHLAELRDKVELETLKTRQAIHAYLEYLIQVSANYTTINEILSESQKKLSVSQTVESALVLPEVAVEGQIFSELKNNLRVFRQVNATYVDLLKFVINNPRQIASTHWFQEFSLLSVISYVNHFDILRPVNQKLTPFKVDIGGVGVSLAIILLVYFSYPFLFKFTSWCIEKYIINEGAEHQALICQEIRKPARTLLIFFGIDLATYAFFYKTDFRPAIEDITFVVYSLLILWLLFKMLDTIVPVQVQKLSKTNTDLRKELFNLGVQTGKAVILLIILAVALNHFGISITAILSTLGIGGLAFALAAKDTLSNLFGGITILFDNVYRMGDWVKISDVEGTVAEIGLRSTTIRTFDNALITIPNAQVSVSSVKNWSRRIVGRRIKMYVGVTYESNMDDVRNAINELREMLRSHPGIANPKQKHGSGRRHLRLSSKEDVHGIKATQLVYLDQYNTSSIDILIYCFSKTVDWAEWLAVKENVLYQIAEILHKHHLDFAYPTQVRIHKTEA